MIAPQEVKEMLPKVLVLMDNKLYLGQVAGRKLDFAKVYVIDDPSRSWEFSWKTIARCLNENRPLRA